jgi:predicted GNAT family acetyltransferase
MSSLGENATLLPVQGMKHMETHGKSNLERLIELADKVFAVKSDPNQLDVNRNVRDRLLRMHPLTVSEYNEGSGPCALVVLIPTTVELMNRFCSGEITEKELFELTPELTPLDVPYEAIYLCSALVLDEYRRKGITKNLALKAIEEMRKEYPLKAAFVWPFSAEGDRAAEMIAETAGLPLYKRYFEPVAHGNSRSCGLESNPKRGEYLEPAMTTLWCGAEGNYSQEVFG